MLQMCSEEIYFLQGSYVLANVSALDLNSGLRSLPSHIWEGKVRFVLSIRLKHWAFFFGSMENLSGQISKNHNKPFFVTFHFKAKLLALLNLVVLVSCGQSTTQTRLKPYHFSWNHSTALGMWQQNLPLVNNRAIILHMMWKRDSQMKCLHGKVFMWWKQHCSSSM